MTGRIVDNGPHAVDVYPRVEADTDMGAILTDATEPVRVEHVRVSARTGDFSNIATPADGARLPATVHRIVGAGEWPGNDGCKVVIVEGAEPGRVLRQIGDAIYRASNPRTAHYAVTLRAQGVIDG